MLERKRKVRNAWKSVGASIVAMMLVIALAVGMMPNDSAQVFAAEKISDLDTTTKYTESFGDNVSTEYAGRVWTDKTVYSGSEAEFDVYTSQAEKDEGIEQKKITVSNDSDFLVSFSTLATSQAISGKTKAPLDVVFVIDLSGSMSNADSEMTSATTQETKSRIAFTVDAVNKAITSIMEMNEYTRVGVVGFNETAVTLLPLGRYSPQAGSNAIFSLSRTNASRYYAELYTRATNTVTNANISLNTSVSGGTNIQHGMYQGMNLLATTTSTTATIEGKTVQRVPSVVILSDGSPTYSCEDAAWYAPQIITGRGGNYQNGYGVQGPGSSSYYGNGMLAMMTGAYMKAAIDRNYQATESQDKATVYTIGMGIEDLVEVNDRGQVISTSDRDLARVTLNPATYFDSTTNSHAVSIKNAWQQYCGTTGNDTTPNITVNNRDNYTLNHPTANDISGDALKTYVNTHYDADDADSVAAVFQNIVDEISISTPEIPTEHDTENPMTSGYITYTDPIGQYMEVKDFKAILYGGKKYEAHEKSTSGDVTTYTFTEVTEGNEVYGEESLEYILITVTTTTNEAGIKEQELKIQIPAALIPIRVNTVRLNSDGAVETHTNNGTYPIRVLYTVGLQDAVKAGDHVALEKIDEEYKQKYLREDGTIDFYSNLYTGIDNPYKTEPEYTMGNATAEFKAASTNPFYYMQEDTILYVDEACETAATGDSLEDDKTYYYKEVFYHGTNIEETIVARTGAQLAGNTTIQQNENGEWYRVKGTVRVNRMLEFEGEKTLNSTETATDFYTPTYDSTTNTFKIYLGNNGVMSVNATGTLDISKTVTADEGLTVSADKEFTFTVKLDQNAGTYNYMILDASGNPETDSNGDVVLRQIVIDEANGGTLTLKAGQTARIINLLPDTGYTVTEADADGFATKVTLNGTEVTDSDKQASGTIKAGAVEDAEFVNHYSVTSVRYPAEGDFSGTKVLSGRPWNVAEGNRDEFTFFITPYNNAPLPEGYNETTGVVVTEPTGQNADGNDVAEFVFGAIEFTKPGTYRYTIVEKEPENSEYLPGMTYSGALYRLVIEVEDNGSGQLVVTSSEIQRLYDDEANALFTYDSNMNIVFSEEQQPEDPIVFTNSYSVDGPVTRVPVALKEYTDHSGQKPLESGMFTFKLTPLGVVGADGEVEANTSDLNPMPLDADGNKLTSVTTENEGRNVTFLPVVFEQSHILSGNSTTYRYRMEEDLTSVGATAENGYTVNGMVYDAEPWIVDVTVSVSPESTALIVDEVYPNEANIATFTNVYDPTDLVLEGSTAIQGTKTMVGRDMKDGETFTFTLVGADEATRAAITDGVVIPTSASATVQGGKDNQAVAFDFGKTTFTKPGTYTFYVQETIPEDATADNNYTVEGVKYDTHVCTVTVNVEDNNGTLELVNDVVVYSDNTFSNEYDAVPVGRAAAFNLSGTKELTGRILREGDFFFAVNPQPVNGDSDNLAPVGIIAREVFKPNAAGSDADGDGTYVGSISLLKDVVYTEAGTYVYYIKEQLPKEDNVEVTELDGVTYDTAEYQVTVTVTDKLDGTLVIEEDGVQVLKKDDNGQFTISVNEDEIVFQNKYETEDHEFAAGELTKIFTGREWKENETFSFERTIASANPKDGIVLLDKDGNEVTGDDIVTVTQNGTFAFGNIKFTKPGTYTVQIVEVIPELAKEENNYTHKGITYDTNVATRTFRVEDDLNGKLLVYVDGTSGSSVFRNVYNGTGTLVGATDLNVTKVFTGRGEDKTEEVWLPTDNFQFALDPADDVTRDAVANGDIVMPQNAANITITADDEDKQLAFGDIVFYATGEYKFIVREKTDNPIPGVDYDIVTERTINVVVTDNGDGTFKPTATVEEAQGLTYTNVYNPDDVILYGDGNLHVTKELEGREWLTADAFEFTLEVDMTDADTEAARNAGNIIMPGDTVDANGNITSKDNVDELTITMDSKELGHFGNITFKEPGTYKFKVKETEGSIAGITYDKTEKTVIVNVVDNADGTMTVSIADSSDELTFTNNYSTKEVTIDGETYLSVNKTIEGREWTADDSFDFTISTYDEVTEQAVINGDIVLPATLTIKDKTEGYTHTAFFKEGITFKKAGDYVFVIREVKPEYADANMAYDTHYVLVEVSVTDNKQGQLVVEQDAVNVIGSMTWVNVHTPDAINVRLEGVKLVSGREMNADDRYEFMIEAADGTPMPSILTTMNAQVGTNGTAAIQFGAITFNKEHLGDATSKTFQYIIRETGGSVAGIVKDTGYVVATVVITNDTQEGQLKSQVSYEKYNAAGTKISDTFEFVNYYSATGSLEGKTNLRVTKNLVGRQDNQWLESDEFTFTLKADLSHDATKQAMENEDIEITTSEITVDKDNRGNAYFDDIVFYEKGEYQFIVSEVLPEGATEENNYTVDGIAYDTTSKIVKVSAVDNGDGTLTVTLKDDSEALVFTNTYDPDDATLDGETNLVVTKNLSGRDWFTSDVFKFELVAADAYTNVVMTDPTTVEIRGSQDAKTAYFGDIQFKEVGTYQFHVSEVTAEGDKITGVTYDTSVKTVIVTVYDNNKGQLVAELAETSEDLVFNNSYKPAQVTATLTGVKEMSGRDLKETDKFEFTITPVKFVDSEGNEITDAAKIPMPETATVSNDNSVIKFAPISYKEAGTYTYAINETGGSAAGVENTENTVTATVVVTYDKTTGQLSVADPVYSEGGFVFVNTYTTKPVTVNGLLNTTKTVTPANPENTYEMVGGEFTFTLTPGENNPSSDPIKEAIIAKNDADGNVVFVENGSVTFTESGTYTYTIRETNETTQTGMHDDDAVYEVVVVVEDDEAEAQLKATVTVTKDDEALEDAQIKFENIYEPLKASAIFEGTKELTGSKDLEDGEFTFALTPIVSEDGQTEVPMPADAVDGVATTKNTNAGVFQFGRIEYDKVGIYQYKVVEVNDGKTGYTYDDTEYTVTVTVTDNEGTLEGKVEIAGADSIAFVNDYTPIPVTVLSPQLTGTKNLEGRDLNAGEFAFQLIDENDELVQEVTNNGEGTFAFDDLTFTEVGIYYYTIVERNTGLGGVTYDDSTYTLMIDVTDVEGNLQAEITYWNEDEPADLVFNNSYSTEAVAAQVAVTKDLDGRVLKADEFTFVLMDENNEVIEKVKNDANGIVLFGGIEYGEAGTYKYFITEEKGEDKFVTYDETVYEVVVVVEDNLEGQLTKTITYYKNGEKVEQAQFVNAYKAAPTTAQISALKTLKGRELAAGEFTFVLEDANGNKIYAVNEADGTILFDEITFTEVGTYVYKVYEEKGTLENVTYDDSVFFVTVTVEDDFAGNLIATVSDNGEEVVFVNTYTEPVVKPEPEEPKPEPKPVIPTGDSAAIMSTLATMLASAGCVVTVLAKKRRKK